MEPDGRDLVPAFPSGKNLDIPLQNALVDLAHVERGAVARRFDRRQVLRGGIPLGEQAVVEDYAGPDPQALLRVEVRDRRLHLFGHVQDGDGYALDPRQLRPRAGVDERRERLLLVMKAFQRDRVRPLHRGERAPLVNDEIARLRGWFLPPSLPEESGRQDAGAGKRRESRHVRILPSFSGTRREARETVNRESLRGADRRTDAPIALDTPGTNASTGRSPIRRPCRRRSAVCLSIAIQVSNR